MAITNAQQYQQLVNKPADGKRPGYRGDDAARAEKARSGSYGSRADPGGAGRGDTRGDPGPADDRSSALQTYNQQVATGTQLPPQLQKPIELNKREQEFQNFLNRRNKVNLFGLSKAFTGPAQKFSDFNASINRPFFEKVIRAGKIPGLNFDATEEEFEEAYQNYMSERLAGNIDAYGNPLKGNYYDSSGNLVVTPDDGPDQPIIPMTPVDPSEGDDEETSPGGGRDMGGLAPRFSGSIFDFTGLADGGRAGFKEGGGIMPRLNELSGGVSSAEQMLQEINQRLESAESSLGSGGSGFTQPAEAGSIVPGIAGYESRRETGIGQPIQLAQPIQMPIGQPREITQLLTQPNNTAQGMEGFAPSLAFPNAPSSPIAGAMRQGAMDGGIMNTEIVGGMMDGNMDEMGRQMYGLGKLVKKATRAVKKVAKSPIGKAVLLNFAPALIPGGASTFFGGSKAMFGLPSFLKSEGLKKFFLKEGAEKFALKNLSQKGLMAGIAGLSALPFIFQGDEEEENFDPYRGPEIDIANIRSNPYNFLAPRFQGSTYAADGGRIGYQEGGDAEPVAKKTMPLIDMDGKEKDYRETGGFVDMGRMERADDVPARLSKNEFVFTADAVRNAGEGDIDKGAEVMYNMMKNLEAGGEVSEESQGLEGAREMFKTSQRLEEVL